MNRIGINITLLMIFVFAGAFIAWADDGISAETDTEYYTDSEGLDAFIYFNISLQGDSPGFDYSQAFAIHTNLPYAGYESGPYYEVGVKYPLTYLARGSLFVGFNSIDYSNVNYTPPEGLETDFVFESSFSGFPVGALFEIVPFHGQFRSHVGFGGGMEVGNYRFSQINTFSERDNDPRDSEYEENLYSLFLRAAFGFELGFDENWREGIIAGIAGNIMLTRYFRGNQYFGALPIVKQEGIGSTESTDFFPYQINFGVSLLINVFNRSES
ncbi:MAG: hypothetical protein Kapaf2KO_09880 [Candidatus Kapaibacteriales bacterium]